MDVRQVPTRKAAAALALWLVAVLLSLAWWRPNGWTEPHERFARAEALARERRWKEALALVDDALASRPDDVGYLVFKGYRHIDVFEFERAEDTFRRALALDRSNVDAALGLASAQLHRGASAAALRTLSTMPAASMSAGQVRQRGQLYVRLGAHAAALDDLSHLLHQHPDDPALLHEAALQARALGEWERTATLTLRLGTATNDRALQRWAADTRGEALRATGRPADALDAYQAADSPATLETRAALANQLKQPEAAVRYYRELARSRPHDLALRRSLAFALHDAGRTGEAEQAFRALVADGGADRGVRVAYAWLLNTGRRHAEAWRVLEPLPRPDRDLEVLELQARTALWAGQSHDAVHLLTALVGARPHRAELWKRLAESWQAAGDERQAAAALTAYLRLETRDADARRQLADMLARNGSLAAAVAEYRALAAADPGTPALLRRLGVLEETAGELDAAKASYVAAIEAGDTGTDLPLRLARLHRWTAQPADAVRWYETYIAAEHDTVLRARAESELALSLLESGDARASLARVRTAGSSRTLDEGELLTAARAAAATADPAAAARFLEALRDRRALTAAEDAWLAGMYRAAGDVAEALAAYERAASSAARPAPDVLEAIGDLRYGAGDFAGALAAYDTIPGADAPMLKAARAAAAAGRQARARDAYLRHLRNHPADVDAQLEAARAHAAAGRPHEALTRYAVVIGERGAADLRVELARAHLGAHQFAAAERWAREALAAGEDPDEAALALAQSLHLQGRPREADVLLAAAARQPATRAEALVWRTRAATALDRHLAAYRSAEDALAAGAPGRDRLLLSMSEAARRRGDYARARTALARVAPQQETASGVAAARRELERDTWPALYVPAWFHGDSNGLGMTGAAAGIVLVLPGGLGRMALDGSSGTVAAGAFSSGRTGVALTLDRLFPAPEVELAFGVGLDRFDRAGDLFAWRAQGTYYRANGSTLGAVAAREGLLPDGRQELRQFNRVLDLAAIGPAFHLHSLRGFADTVVSGDRRLRVELGADAFADGNRRLSSYLHYQLPLASGAREWVVLRPNLYVESFRDTRAAYFSPARHLTAGVMVHAVRRFPSWHLELEANPQWLRTGGDNGFGLHGLLAAGATLGRVVVRGGTFVFYDGLENYLQRRIGAQVTIPVGR